MITIKGSVWRKEDFTFVADVIRTGISEICIDYNQNCKRCPVRKSCNDLKLVADYCELKMIK